MNCHCMIRFCRKFNRWYATWTCTHCRVKRKVFRYIPDDYESFGILGEGLPVFEYQIDPYVDHPNAVIFVSAEATLKSGTKINIVNDIDLTEWAIRIYNWHNKRLEREPEFELEDVI